MGNFKYTLDKGSKKFICPNCRKKSFVRYVDNETDNYLADNYGRCDRESKCGLHQSPPRGKKAFLISFLSIQDVSPIAIKAVDENGGISFIPKSQVLERIKNDCWVTEWYLKKEGIRYLGNESKYFNSNNAPIINIVSAAIVEPEKPSFHSLTLIDQLFHEKGVKDNLRFYLESIFPKAEVFQAMQNYFLTGTNHYWRDATVFWQIDHKEQVHAGKIMLYNRSTGRRVKEPYSHINWMHNAIKEPDFVLRQCLFGLHRINEDYDKKVAIVESEKTAIIMSIIVPDVIWLATGAKNGLKLDKLKPLKHREIVLYPDKGEYEAWQKVATEATGSRFKISVSNLLEDTELEPGADLADCHLYESKIV